MNLKDYPAAIAQLQVKLNSLDFLIENLQRNIKLIEAEVENAIAFDSSLTNDSKRKAKRAQLLDEHQQYWELTEAVSSAKAERLGKAIEYEQCRNEFSVMKLETRERIARVESYQD